MTEGTDTAVRQAAQHWVARLASREIRAEEMREFRLWHDASEQHSEAFRSERYRWLQLERTREVFERSIARDKERARQRRRIWMPVGGAIAAMLVMFIAIGNPVHWLQADHATHVGEIRAWDLPDGSKAWLSSDSAIDVAYDANTRRIRLLKGEAWFDVRHAPERPFIVAADDVEAVAKGTAFSVTRANRGVSVEVTKGIVEVRRDGATAAELTAGMAADLDADAARVHAFTEADALSWRERKIALNDLSLDDALAEIERYRTGRILLLGEGQAQSVSAILTLDRLDEGLEAIATSHGLSVLHLTPWLTIVR
ncbi:FecR family protein [Steroidobacter flavus]|uniref:FecR family protein n=1 Tax=Steroidobacter flavus TaxID=1842136 RepID=A0ABV8T1L8_9GAMM